MATQAELNLQEQEEGEEIGEFLPPNLNQLVEENIDVSTRYI